jgi:hypothetical protein
MSPLVWSFKCVQCQPQHKPTGPKQLSLLTTQAVLETFKLVFYIPVWTLVWGKINKPVSLYTIQNISNVQNKYSDTPQNAINCFHLKQKAMINLLDCFGTNSF